MHAWRKQSTEDAAQRVNLATLTPVPSLVGHYGAVVSACWGIDGGCLLTAGEDQTVRITVADARGAWFEFARPQVHGHNFHAVVAIPTPGQSRILMASASEEKVIRVFQAPRAFVQSLSLLRGSEFAGADDGPLGATVPALGLSNKAVTGEQRIAPASTDGGAFGYEAGPDFAPHQQPTVVEVLSRHLVRAVLRQAN